MSLENNFKYKNRYTFFEIFSLGISVLFTRIFYPKAKLISYPVYIRGKKSLDYDEGLNVGYGCRFDLLNPEKKTLFIGKNCEIGDYCHFVATNKVKIGDNFLCASKVFISDTNHGHYRGKECTNPNIPPRNRILKSASIEIGDNVWVGDNVVILDGTEIGNGCVIGANSVVKGKIPKNSIAVGVPARVIKRFSEETGMWEALEDKV